MLCSEMMLHQRTLSLACGRSIDITPREECYEPELEQGYVDGKSRDRSRGAVDDGRQSGRDILARDEPFMERCRRVEAGEDGVASLRRLEHQELAIGRHRREVREEGG